MTEADKQPTYWLNMSKYHHLSLIDLCRKIVVNSDYRALEEFHNRTLFSYKRSKLMPFIDYLNILWKGEVKNEWPGCNALEIADIAYDLTVEKFCNLPGSTDVTMVSRKKNKQNVKHGGCDCRLYFRAFLERIKKSFKNKRSKSQLDEEYRSARIMQGLVRRHFYLSRLEAERKSKPFRSRYYWNIGGVKICVWLPVSLKGNKRRKWLEKNIDDPDPSRPEERQRIQMIIDKQLVKERFIHFYDEESFKNIEKPLLWADSDESSGIDLSEVIADEKAMNIEMQRRSIRILGKEKLKKLIIRIFKDISSDVCKDGKVAKDFDISKSTFSRFAGSRWQQSNSAIPDLWLNTAHVLSTHSIFKKVAIKTGVWKQIETTLNSAINKKIKRIK